METEQAYSASMGTAIPMIVTMKRHEWWRQQYRQRRYLEHTAAEELKERFNDLMGNLGDFDAEGRFALKNPKEEGQWIELFTHVLEELQLRGEAVGPDLLRGAHFDLRRYVSRKRAADLWRGYDLPLGSYLVKFGKLRYLAPLLNVGSFRIAPASSYQDPSLNFAIRDSELEFTEVLYGAKIRHPPNGDYTIPVHKWVDVPVIGNVKSTLRSDSDYYLTCFSASYEYRLFDDFGGDACIVIKDTTRFIRSVRSRMEEALPGWRFSFDEVSYRDPYHASPNLNVFFCKHFRFAYQREVRLVWQPPTGRESLRPVHLELGPLKDYCDLLKL